MLLFVYVVLLLVRLLVGQEWAIPVLGESESPWEVVVVRGFAHAKYRILTLLCIA